MKQKGIKSQFDRAILRSLKQSNLTEYVKYTPLVASIHLQKSFELSQESKKDTVDMHIECQVQQKVYRFP